MIDKIDNKPLYETDNSNQAMARKCTPGNSTDATLRTDYDLLISGVIESSNSDTQRVEQAKKLLTDNIDKLKNLAETLLEKEVMDASEVRELLGLPPETSTHEQSEKKQAKSAEPDSKHAADDFKNEKNEKKEKDTV